VPGHLGHIIVQICRSRFLAVCVWANATVTMASRCDLRQRGGSSPLSRAEPGGEGTGFGHLQRPSFIPTGVSESCCRPMSSADLFVSRRAEPNPGRRGGHAGWCGPYWDQQIKRHLLRPCVWHLRLGRNAEAVQPSFGRPSLCHPSSGRAHVRTLTSTSTSTTDVDVVYMQGGTVRSHRQRRRRCRGA
jgi:hypothetical protein